jgi:predicted kinase
MPKVFLLRGLPASGKSSRAKQIMKENKKTVRLNKDLLREMFSFGDFDFGVEQYVVDTEYHLVQKFLSAGYNVIVDDTNFNEGHEKKYRQIAEPIHTVEVIYLDTDVDECIKRDAARGAAGGRLVGKDNIKNMAFRAGILKQEKECVVFDIDGTLADITHRRHYVCVPKGEKKDLDGFFAHISEDTPRKEIVDKLLAYKEEGKEIILSSGRGEEYRQGTEEWLEKHNIPYDRLIMRPKNDRRPDTTVKAGYIKYYLNKKKIVAWHDDRPSVVRVIKAEGINVIDEGDGQEF